MEQDWSAFSRPPALTRIQSTKFLMLSVPSAVLSLITEGKLCFRSSVGRSRMVLSFCLLQTSVGCFASEDGDLKVQVCLGVQIQFHIAGMSISTSKCLWDSGLKSGLSVL